MSEAKVEPGPQIIRVGRASDGHAADMDRTMRRTAAKGLLAQGLGIVQNSILPSIALAFTFRDDGMSLPLILGIFFSFILVFCVVAYLQWLRLTYRVGEADIRVESGLLSRQARSVPYDRIQDVSVEQSLIPRLLGLVSIKFETGAGGKDEIALAYLTEEEGERLREVVRSRRDGEQLPTPGDTDVTHAPEAGAPLFAMDGKRVLTFGIFEFSLAVVAAAFAGVQQFDFLFPFDPFSFREWRQVLAGPGAWLSGLGVAAQVVGAVIATLGLLLIGFATGLIRTVLREWNFTLRRTDKGFRRQRGLLTRTDVVMPIHRVQALHISSGLIRKQFGWHGLKLISLAQDSGNASHDAAPFAQWEELAPIVAESGFEGPESADNWHWASHNYRFDNMFFSSIFIVLAGAIIFGVLLSGVIDDPPDLSWWTGAGFVVLGIAVAVKEWIGWRKRVHALTATQIFYRRGIFHSKIYIANRQKLQSVEIAQGPIAQRRGYASVRLGLAGGTFTLDGLPLERARELRTRLLDSMTDADFSELNVA